MYRIMDFDPAKKVTHEMVLARIHPEDRSIIEEAQRVAIPVGEGFNTAFRIVTDDGTVKHLRSSSRRLAEAPERLIYVGATQDVTEKKLAEESLRRSEAFLAEGQRLSMTGSFVWRPDTDEIVFSDELKRIFEFELSESVKIEAIVERVHPDDVSLVAEKIEQARSGSGDHDYELRLRMPDESVKYLHTNAHAIRRPDGYLEFVGAMQDVTQQRVSEEALTQVRSELAHAARVMSLGTLTASIAHEVNQPLSGIITNAGTCVRMLDADPPNIDGARETARRTIRDGNRASEVITRLRALFARKDFTREAVDLNAAAEEVIALSRSEMRRNEIVVETELAEEVPLVDGDRVQLQQVILNLLLNASDAMKNINDRPRIVTLITEKDGVDRVCFHVRDVGIGLSPDFPEKLFEPFYTTKENGMGIGLSVSRSIIERHHGRLWVKPNDGPGATFSFTIPNAV